MVAKQQILMPAQMPLPSEVPTPGHTDGTGGPVARGCQKKMPQRGKALRVNGIAFAIQGPRGHLHALPARPPLPHFVHPEAADHVEWRRLQRPA